MRKWAELPDIIPESPDVTVDSSDTVVRVPVCCVSARSGRFEDAPAAFVEDYSAAG